MRFWPHECCVENYTSSRWVERPLMCNLCANRVWLPVLQAWWGQFNLCPSAIIRMPLESGADGEGQMETDQPWVGVRVPERAGCLPPVQAFLLSFLPGCCPWATLSPVATPWIWSKGSKLLLTICCHANVDAFFKATFLALISCNFVYDTLSFIFTGIGWMEIFLNGSSKETLHEKERPKTAISDCLEIKARQHFASSYHGGWFWTSPVYRPVALPVPVQAADPKWI